MSPLPRSHRWRVRLSGEGVPRSFTWRWPAFDKARASIDFLASRPDVDDHRLGLVGCCMGGDFALALGIDDRIRATAPNCGKAPSDEHLRDLCPVVASFGNKDRMFRNNAARLEAVLNAAGVDNDIKLYPNAGHSFINTYAPWYTAIMGPVMAVGYHHDEAENAWSRMLAFFERQMPDTRYQIPDTRHQTPDTRHQTPDT